MKIFFYFFLFFSFSFPCVKTNPSNCESSEGNVVRDVSKMPQDSYGRKGLSHITVSGNVHHGNKEVEMWMQTFAPGSGTPIHRHDCEEIFYILKGSGTLYLGNIFHNASTGIRDDNVTDTSMHNDIPRTDLHNIFGEDIDNFAETDSHNVPGKPFAHNFSANSTFFIVPNQVHQVLNTDENEDLQLLAVFSKPPIKIYKYQSWSEHHVNAQLHFPYPWDNVCPNEIA